MAAKPPHIVYILCDDLGYGDVGVFHQNERAARKDRSVPYFETPALDQLAGEGRMLTRHYCSAPVCAPSRASFLTGLTQGHATVRDNQFDKALPDTWTVGSVLQEAGYATAAIGKWGLQGKRPEDSQEADWESYPTRRGFDFFFGYVRHRDGHQHYPKEKAKEVWENGREISEELDLCYTTDLFAARAKKWIVDHVSENQEQPFFLFLSYDTPHAVLDNPPCPFPEGAGLEGGLQWTGQPGKMINTARGGQDSYLHPAVAEATWDHDNNAETAEQPWPNVQKRYANLVRRIDQATGDVVQLIDDLGLQEETLIIFSSDNGPSRESYLRETFDPTFFQGYGRMTGIKRDTWEGGLREPTIVRWPGKIPAGEPMRTPSGQWDWLATFAEAADLPAPAFSDGASLLPALLAASQPEGAHPAPYMEYLNRGKTPGYPDFPEEKRQRRRGQMQVVFVDGYKGIRYDVSSAQDDFEIYDVEEDPGERKNLAATALGEELQPRMKAAALRQRRPNASAKRPYDGAPIPALAAAPSGEPGLTCSWFAGDWPWLPDFRKMSPAGSRRLSEPSLPEKALAADGLLLQGYFRVEEEGVYHFRASGGSESMLFVHECRVLASGVTSGEEAITLGVGWHPIRVLVRDPREGEPLALQVKAPGGDFTGLETFSLRAAE
ncbi:sulfatase-like hydrolase/transferase [Roseibacillus ishigakijimensis]|uniref:sulfatase-like hydrolase/transferase n=1 Tax=Roseibacillus ishigakijimensis TaxID=454146 RepID=UPI001906EC8F|nr:sulfatase-like hydrolase/transferase [Roseibacillus ishigakijimensis]